MVDSGIKVHASASDAIGGLEGGKNIQKYSFIILQVCNVILMKKGGGLSWKFFFSDKKKIFTKILK